MIQPSLYPAPPRRRARRVRVGTSGFVFKDWTGPFYPRGLRPRDALRFYAEHFDTLEVNVTWYRIPEPRLLESMAERTPEDFDFVVKLHRDLTHARRPAAVTVEAMRRAVAPLHARGRLQGLLAQFPYAFRNTTSNRAYLLDLRRAFPQAPLFVEFRRREWVTPATVDFLRRHDLGYVCVDAPPLPPLVPPEVHVTLKGAGYVRLHGRNAASWWEAAPGSDRYDYRYSEAELQVWADKVRRMLKETERVYVFFNNCHAGQAPVNAQAFQALMDVLDATDAGEAGCDQPPPPGSRKRSHGEGTGAPPPRTGDDA